MTAVVMGQKTGAMGRSSEEPRHASFPSEMEGQLRVEGARCVCVRKVSICCVPAVEL